MSEGYIYPQWQRAKRHLIEQLMNGPRPIDQIVEDWFRQHVFNVGVSVSISSEALTRGGDDIRQHYANLAASQIGRKLFEDGLFTKAVGADRFSEITSYEVLVFGDPWAVQPGTRERRKPSPEPGTREGGA